MPQAGDSPRRSLRGPQFRDGYLREKLPQADAEAPENQGLSSVSFCAGLLDLERAVPELEDRHDAVAGSMIQYSLTPWRAYNSRLSCQSRLDEEGDRISTARFGDQLG